MQLLQFVKLVPIVQPALELQFLAQLVLSVAQQDYRLSPNAQVAQVAITVVSQEQLLLLPSASQATIAQVVKSQPLTTSAQSVAIAHSNHSSL